MSGLRGGKPILRKRDKREKKGKGYYFCPKCLGKYKNSKWRQKQKERRICKNNHARTVMLWYLSLSDVLSLAYPKARR